jgi:hypothetical protein
MMATSLHTRRFVPAAALVALAVVTACEERLSPRRGGIADPPITAPTGQFNLVEVNDDPLPHETNKGDTTLSMIVGTLTMDPDSTWQFARVEQLKDTNGTVISTEPGSFTGGRWTVTGSTINMLPSSGTMTVKGDTLFWIGAPKHPWETTLKFTLLIK